MKNSLQYVSYIMDAKPYIFSLFRHKNKIRLVARLLRGKRLKNKNTGVKNKILERQRNQNGVRLAIRKEGKHGLSRAKLFKKRAAGRTKAIIRLYGIIFR